MKKITLFLTMLLVSLVAWGQTRVNTVNTEKYYTLNCRTTDGHGNNSGTFISDNEGTLNGRSAEGTFFQFELAGDGTYYLKSCVSQKYLNGATLTESKESATKWKIKNDVAGVTDKSVGLNVNGTTQYLNNNHGSSPYLKLANHNPIGSDNNCSLWYLSEYDSNDPVDVAKVGLEEKIEAAQAYNTDGGYSAASVAVLTAAVAAAQEYLAGTEITVDGCEGHIAAIDEAIAALIYEPFIPADSYGNITNWYYIKLKNEKYLYHTAEQSYIALDKTAVDKTNKDAYTWAFVGNSNDGYQIVNKATGDGYILSSSTTMSGDTGAGTYPIMTATPVAEGNNTYWVVTKSTNFAEANGFFLAQKDNASNRMNNRADKLAYWTGGADAGSTFIVEERPVGAVAELEALIEEATEVLNNMEVGEGYGQCVQSYYDDLNNAITTASNVEVATDEDVTTLQAAIDAANAAPVNMPKAGDLIAFKSAAVGADRTYCAGKYVKNLLVPVTRTEYGVKKEYNHTVLTFDELDPATTPSAVFMVEDNGNGGLILKNMHTQQYVISFKKNDNQPTHMGTKDEAVDITFTHLGKKQFNVIGSNDTYPMHAQAAYSIIVTWEGGLETCSAWYIEEVETFVHTLDVSAAGKATLQLGFDAVIPNGVRAYYASEAVGNYIKMEEITGILPANTPVLIEATENNYDFTYSATPGTAVEGNLLEGDNYQTDHTDAGYTYYVLAMPDGAEEAALYADEFANSKFVNGANKAYFKVEKTAGAQNVKAYSFSFSGEGTTGIENVESAVENNVYYDLSGRRVENPVKGLYIVNGKKVLVK